MTSTVGVSRRILGTEVLIVLGVSVGASALWAVLRIIERLTRDQALAEQTAALNRAQVPDRPWLDLAFQLTGHGLALVPVLLALFLLARTVGSVSPEPALAGAAVPTPVPAPAGSPKVQAGPPEAPAGSPEGSGAPTAAGTGVLAAGARAIGLDLRRPSTDLGTGLVLAAVIGIPGIGLYLAAYQLGLSARIAPANLPDVWWAVPVLILAAVQTSLVEEVIGVGYLFARLRQLGWAPAAVIAVHALLRGAYHLYQGFGGLVGNAVMGVVFGLVYLRVRRVMPLVVAHVTLDVVAFVGYALLHEHVSWLP